MSNLKNFFFTSESVSEGHPDKVSDRISDMVVDSYLAGDPFSRVACETLTTTNKVVLAGEVRGPEIKKEETENMALSRLNSVMQMNPAGAQSMASGLSFIPSNIIPEEPAITDSEMADVSNKIAMKVKLRTKLSNGDKAAEILALYKLIATDSERRALSMQHIDHTTKGDKINVVSLGSGKEPDEATS